MVLGAGKASAEIAVGLEEMLGRHLSGGTVVVPRLFRAAAFSGSGCSLPTTPFPQRPVSRRGGPCSKPPGNSGRGTSPYACSPAVARRLPAYPRLVSPQTTRSPCTGCSLASGMSIVEINTVRKHVSGLKGGRLARAIAPARIVNLTVSDVVGDPLDCITDPTVQDTSTVADATAVLADYGLLQEVPRSVRAHLSTGPGRSRLRSATSTSRACS